MKLLTNSVVKHGRQRESDADAHTLAWHGMAWYGMERGYCLKEAV